MSFSRLLKVNGFLNRDIRSMLKHTHTYIYKSMCMCLYLYHFSRLHDVLIPCNEAQGLPLNQWLTLQIDLVTYG